MNHSQLIQTLLTDCAHQLASNISALKSSAEALLSQSKKENDLYATTNAYLYLGKYYLEQNDLDTCSNYLATALKLSQEGSFYDLLGITYNTFASLEILKGNEHTSMDFFFRSLDYLLKIKAYNALYTTYGNISVIFYNIGEYEKSLEYAFIARKYLRKYSKKQPDAIIEDGYYFIEDINLALTYLKLGDLKHAKLHYEKLKKNSRDELITEYMPCIMVIKIKLAFAQNQMDHFVEYIKELITYARANNISSQIVTDYFDLFDGLIEIKNYELANEMLELQKDSLKSLNSTTMDLIYYYKKKVYIEKTNDINELNRLYPIYYECSRKKLAELVQIKQSNLLGHIKIEQHKATQKEKNERMMELEQQASYDYLTGLYNRYLLNNYCNRQFSYAIEKKIPFGIMILDVNDFKQFNDTYGHLIGDYCLMQVAECVKDLGTEYLSARFGGDEIVMVAINRTEEQLEIDAKNLSEHISQKHVLHSNGIDTVAISVTIGFYSAIPEVGQEFNDFFRRADKFLYQKKELRKSKVGSIVQS